MGFHSKGPVQDNKLRVEFCDAAVELYDPSKPPIDNKVNYDTVYNKQRLLTA